MLNCRTFSTILTKVNNIWCFIWLISLRWELFEKFVGCETSEASLVSGICTKVEVQDGEGYVGRHRVENHFQQPNTQLDNFSRKSTDSNGGQCLFTNQTANQIMKQWHDQHTRCWQTAYVHILVNVTLYYLRLTFKHTCI